MSDGDRFHMDPRRVQEIMRRRLTRRGFLKGAAGAGVAGVSLAALLAACAEDGGPGPGGNGGISPADIYDGEFESGAIQFANWPIYIDKALGGKEYPSLDDFRKESGLEVNYQEIIQDNAEFFGKIQPQLAAGDPTGYDIVVITNGREFTVLTKNEWVWPLDPDRRPNFDANALGWAKDPDFDPGNKYSMCWQSGVTGVAINHDLIKGEFTKFDDLMNPDIVGVDSVNMLRSDMPEFVMINLGIDPTTSGPDEWREAAAWLQKQKESGVVRGYVTQGYTTDMTAGNVSTTMAWSGDVLYYALWAGYPNLEFIGPPTIGALLWIDNMMIPANAEHPDSAMAIMDYYYDVVPATMVAEWVFYMSPVQGVRDLILQHADEAKARGEFGFSKRLQETADSNYLFPDDEFLSYTSLGFPNWTDEAAAEWDAIFAPIWQT